MASSANILLIGTAAMLAASRGVRDISLRLRILKRLAHDEACATAAHFTFIARFRLAHASRRISSIPHSRAMRTIIRER